MYKIKVEEKKGEKERRKYIKKVGKRKEYKKKVNKK